MVSKVRLTLSLATETLSNQTRNTYTPVQRLGVWKITMFRPSETEGSSQDVCARDARHKKTSAGEEHNEEIVQELLYYLLRCEECSHKIACQVVLKKNFLSPDG